MRVSNKCVHEKFIKHKCSILNSAWILLNIMTFYCIFEYGLYPELVSTNLSVAVSLKE